MGGNESDSTAIQKERPATLQQGLGGHPSTLGSYLIAAVFYGTIFRRGTWKEPRLC